MAAEAERMSAENAASEELRSACRAESSEKEEAEQEKEQVSFSVTINTMIGGCNEIKSLYADTHVESLCEMVAKEFGIPSFAVVLMHNESLLNISTGMSLEMAGIEDGSQLFLVKQFGWAKPDVRMMADLDSWRNWRRESF